MRTASALLTLASIAATTACSTTSDKEPTPRGPQVWTNGFPRAGAELPTQEAKADELNKFAVRSLSSNGVATGKSERHARYTLSSFAPVMVQVEPKTRELLERADTYSTISNIAFWAAIAGLAFSSNKNEVVRTSGTVVAIGGLGSVIGFSTASNSQYREAESLYMEALNRRIFGSQGGAGVSNNESHAAPALVLSLGTWRF
jgi:hypothetical protein